MNNSDDNTLILATNSECDDKMDNHNLAKYQNLGTTILELTKEHTSVDASPDNKRILPNIGLQDTVKVLEEAKRQVSFNLSPTINRKELHLRSKSGGMA